MVAAFFIALSKVTLPTEGTEDQFPVSGRPLG
jgi:hypothetical protein